MLNEVPNEHRIPKEDTGDDLVAQIFTYKLVAIQAKFYRNTIQKVNINSIF